MWEKCASISYTGKRDIKRKSIKGRHDPVISWTNSQWNFFRVHFLLSFEISLRFQTSQGARESRKDGRKIPSRLHLTFLLMCEYEYTKSFPSTVLHSISSFSGSRQRWVPLSPTFLFISSLNSFHVYGKRRLWWWEKRWRNFVEEFIYMLQVKVTSMCIIVR